MPDSRLSPDSPGEWLNRAKSDLTIAQSPIPGAYLEDLCYHAQQAVEKALKSLLLHRVGQFPYVHDLGTLVSRLEEASVIVPDHVRDAVVLTKYAVGGRYPGFDEPVTTEEREDACRRAGAVMQWVARQLDSGSGDVGTG